MIKKILAKAYIYLLLAILYAPILIVVVFSFTESKVLGNWTGFSLNLYSSLFNGGVSNSLVGAIENTLSIALLASFFSCLLGTLAAIGLHNMHGRSKQIISFFNNIPMLNPDIITGISLFLLFVALHFTQGYLTVLLAHITFCTPYVVLCVLPKLRQMNPNTYEAALDLGASPFYALRKVIIPQITPGILSGFILAFTLSIDDFAVSLFTKGSQGMETLSTFIYADAHKGGLTPELRPLMSIIFLTVLLLLVVFNVRSSKNTNKR